MQLLFSRHYFTLLWMTGLSLCLLGLNWLGINGSVLAKNNNQVQFLNDRTADIVGTGPLTVKGLVNVNGLTGKGQIIGLADSGLDIGSISDIHPDLQSLPGQMPKVVMLKSWAGREVPDDPIGHGTHMAATIAGTGAASDGQFKGIAPGASIYFQALLDGGTTLEPPTDLTQLFYPAYSAGVRIHINGWGGGSNLYSKSTAQIDAFERRYPDFLPILAAGNNGPTSRSLTAEANSKNALVVGASQSVRPALSPEAVDASQIASFSSRGSTGDGRLKPDLVAPGSAIISASSRLVESNFTGNPLYTRMAGTSMAAAVTGGATALLREWFQVGEGVSSPSAALLKASLINGARLPTGGPNFSEGFGVLDLTSTVLSLQEDSFLYAEAKEGVEAEKFQEYRYQVTEEGTPFKATLAWCDPAASAGTNSALINDLDLLVVGPRGEEYRGNAGLSAGDQPDTQNNVEQVFIPKATLGEYQIKVLGRRVKVPAAEFGSDRLAQDFALVYGQPVVGETVDWVATADEVILSTGKVFKLPGEGVKMIRDGKSVSFSLEQILPGAQLYKTSRYTYIINRTWQAGGVQALPTNQGPLFMEIDNVGREGGFYLDPATEHTIQLNQSEVQGAEDIPSGVEISASLNPATQTLWQVAIGFVEVKGVVLKVDTTNKQIWLLNQVQPYQLSPKAAVSIVDQIIDAGPADVAYGGGSDASLEQVLPGMTLRLMLSPTTHQVQYLAVQRELALGRVVQVDPNSRKLRLESRTEFNILDGATIIRDQKEVALGDLQVGDYVMAVIIPGSGKSLSIVHLTVNTNVTFGRIIYWSDKQNTLYLADHLNQFSTSRVTEETQIYRWGLRVEPASLESGAWIRLTTRPGSDEIWRIDIAESALEDERIVQDYLAVKGQLTFADGTMGSVSSSTLITKNGFWVGPEDLVPGENAQLSWLQGPAPWSAVLASVEVNLSQGTVPPRLEILAQKQAGVVRITGNTSADRLYLYQADGSREKIPVGGDGYFVWYFDFGSSETGAKVMALDSRSGGLQGYQIDINHLAPFGFTDIAGNWATKYIVALSRRGTLSGYLDGTFHPEQAINRAELASLLVRVGGWPNQLSKQIDYSDIELIPPWARNAVTAVKAQGLMMGYQDGSFRPLQEVSRGELAVVLARLLNQKGLIEGHERTIPTSTYIDSNERTIQTSTYNDLAGLPRLMRNSVRQVTLQGIMEGRSEGHFEPYLAATRSEAVAAFYRVLEVLEPKNSDEDN